MAEQGEFPGMGTRIEPEPSSTVKKISIPRMPDLGIPLSNEPEDNVYFIPMGTPLMIPEGRFVRLIRDVPISRDEYERLHQGQIKKTTRRAAGTNLEFLPITLPAQSFPVERLEPRQFRTLWTDKVYQARLRRREGELTIDQSRCYTYTPTPQEQRTGRIQAYGKKAFPQVQRRPQITSGPHT